MLYGSSKILHGPSASEEPRAECLWLPNIINYLRAFTSAVFGQPRPSAALRGSGVARLLMNTNYTFVSLQLNVSRLFSAPPQLPAESRAHGADFMQWMLFCYACFPSARFKVNAVHAAKQTNVFGELCVGEKLIYSKELFERAQRKPNLKGDSSGNAHIYVY